MKGKMIGYVTVGTNDLERAKQFYDNLFGELGARAFFANERIVFWTVKDGSSSFAVAKPYDEEEASVGNGNMVAIPVDSREQVDAIYAKAMELGATDEGPPGERMPTFYGAYIRDLDGNKLVFYKMTAPEDEKSFID